MSADHRLSLVALLVVASVAKAKTKTGTDVLNQQPFDNPTNNKTAKTNMSCQNHTWLSGAVKDNTQNYGSHTLVKCSHTHFLASLGCLGPSLGHVGHVFMCSPSSFL